MDVMKGTGLVALGRAADAKADVKKIREVMVSLYLLSLTVAAWGKRTEPPS